MRSGGTLAAKSARRARPGRRSRASRRAAPPSPSARGQDSRVQAAAAVDNRVAGLGQRRAEALLLQDPTGFAASGSWYQRPRRATRPRRSARRTAREASRPAGASALFCTSRRSSARRRPLTFHVRSARQASRPPACAAPGCQLQGSQPRAGRQRPGASRSTGQACRLASVAATPAPRSRACLWVEDAGARRRRARPRGHRAGASVTGCESRETSTLERRHVVAP